MSLFSSVAPLIAASSLTFTLASQSSQIRDRQLARSAYARAHEYHDQLLKTPEGKRNLNEYSRAVFLYRRVVDHDPTYGASDDALYAIATLYDDMARLFKSQTYRHRAVYYYEFVSEQYPLTRHRSAALQQARSLRNRPDPQAEPIQQKAFATVSEIRYWSSKDYTRVVIQLDREVKFQKYILSDPDRIYFDLKGSRLERSLQGRSYPVNDLFINRIRVAENRPQVVRVVLDFDRIKSHTIFALYNPFRIVIDTHGNKLQIPSEPPSVKVKKESILDEPVSTEATLGTDEVEGFETPPVVPSPNLHGDRSLTRVLGLKVGKIVLDPGHGGSDTGTVGKGGLREKNLVLEVSLRLKRLLQKRLSTEVILTRTEDIFVPLEERTAIANQQGADLFISIHANSTHSREVSGVETYFLDLPSTAEERKVASRENASSQKNIRELENLLHEIAVGDYLEESRDLAHVVQRKLYSQTRVYRPALKNRGVKKAPFIVLIGSSMPSILTEIGFISNPADEKYLKQEDALNHVAEALYGGIEEYFRTLGRVPTFDRATSTASP